MKQLKLLIAAIFLIPAFAANADTIDVTEITDASLNVQNLSNVTLTSSGTNGFFVGSGGFCALATDFSCEEDFQIDFLSSIENLFLSSFGVSTGDSVKISAFLGASFLGDSTISTAGTFDFSGFGVLDRLFFEDTSTAAGIGWNSFRFDNTVASAPEPGTLLLLGLGLAGMGMNRRRKKV